MRRILDKWWTWSAIGFAVGIAIVSLTLPSVASFREGAPPVTDAAVVKVVRPDGIGSGFSIGNHIVVTAAHVVKGAKNVSLKTADGKVVSAEVLWVSEQNDTAFLRTDADIPAAKIACRTAKVGEDVAAVGNPLNVEFIKVPGTVAGAARRMGPVNSVLVFAGPIVMGMSGGPIFGADGKVVGLSSMAMVAEFPGNENATTRQTLAGIGYFVPSSTICMLIGRASE